MPDVKRRSLIRIISAVASSRAARCAVAPQPGSRFAAVRARGWFHGFVALWFGVVSAGSATLHAQTWSWQQPTTQGNTLNAVASGFGFRVAVGVAGTIVRSMADTQWDVVTTPTRNDLNDVEVCNGTFVAVGGGGTILTSADIGATWTAVLSGTTDDLVNVECSDDQVLVALGRRTLLTSTDGASWFAPDTGVQTGSDPFSDSQYAGVIYANGTYLVEVSRGLSGVVPASVLTSTDATSWTIRDLVPPSAWGRPNLFLRSMSFGNGQFTLVHNDAILVSADAVTWSWNQLPTWEGQIAYMMAWSTTFDPSSSTFVGVADLNDPPNFAETSWIIASSADGASWTTQLEYAPRLLRLRAANGKIYGVGLDGAIYARGADGTFSLLAGFAEAAYLGDMLINNGVLVAVGADANGAVILTSSSGSNWQSTTSANLPPGIQSFARITKAGDRYIAVGDTGGGAGIALSDDLQQWTLADLSAYPTLTGVAGVAFNGGVVVATSNANENEAQPFVLRSTDEGATWSRDATNIGTMLGTVLATNSGFLALANPADGNVYSSTDGLAWEVQPIASSGNVVLDIANQGSMTLALVGPGQCGGPGCDAPPTLLGRFDGGVWFPHTLPDIGVVHLGSTGAEFFSSDRDGTTHFTTDGNTWVTEKNPSESTVMAIRTLGDGRFVAVTDRGHILIGGTPANTDRIFQNGFEVP